MKRQPAHVRGAPFWSIEARPWAVISILVAALLSLSSNVTDWLQRDAVQATTLMEMKDSKAQTLHARDREIDALRDEIRRMDVRLTQVSIKCAQ